MRAAVGTLYCCDQPGTLAFSKYRTQYIEVVLIWTCTAKVESYLLT